MFLSTGGLFICPESEAEGLKKRRFQRVKSSWGIPKGKKDDILTWEEKFSKEGL